MQAGACVQAWDFFTESGSHKSGIEIHGSHLHLLLCMIISALLYLLLRVEHPLEDSYILFNNVIHAQEPCKSSIADLVILLSDYPSPMH